MMMSGRVEHHACGHQQVPFLTRSGQEHLQADGQRMLCAVLQKAEGRSNRSSRR